MGVDARRPSDPRVAELAGESRVNRETIGRALRAVPPYDFGEPAPHGGGPHRDRGRSGVSRPPSLDPAPGDQ